MFLMWGYEGEELSDVEATIRHVKTSQPDIFFTTVAYPIKGTPYFAEIGGRVENLQPWKLGSDREVRIRGRHSRRFYGFADKLLRAEVELERSRTGAGTDRAMTSALEEQIAHTRAELVSAATEVEA
jgi:hypothetical protein